jgi:hypothetical protein
MAAGIGLGISMGWTYAKKGFSAAIQGLFAILEARSAFFENANNSKLSVQELETAGLLDKASIILTPTGYSDSVIHNVKPGSGGDMTLIQNGITTRVNENGLVTSNIDDIPRIDYSRGEGAILAEISAVNQIRYSEDFSNSLWTKAAVGLTSSTGTNPRGESQTLYTITRQPAGGDGLHAALVSSASGNGVGMSIWVRRVSGPGSTGNVWLGREPESGAPMFSGAVYAIGSEWQRIEYNSIGYTGTSRMYINPHYGHYFQVWGAQTEKTGGGQIGRVTSYIPTTSSSVTRARDNYLNGGSASLIGAQEGVLYLETAALSQSNTSRGIALSAANSPANRVVIFYSASSNIIQGRVQASTSTTIAINGTIPIGSGLITDFNKIAFKYKSGDLAIWINGEERATSSGTFTFNAALSELALDQGNGSIHFEGLVKTLAVFKEALSDAELAALTS